MVAVLHRRRREARARRASNSSFDASVTLLKKQIRVLPLINVPFVHCGVVLVVAFFDNFAKQLVLHSHTTQTANVGCR